MQSLLERSSSPQLSAETDLSRALRNGVTTDLITPFRWGAVDLHGLAKLVERQIQAGITALSPCGLMGEGSSLSAEERAQVIRACLAAAGGRVPVIPSTGTPSTEASIALTRNAKALGAQAALIPVPYYSKPTQAGILHHLSCIAKAVDLPLIVHDRPDRSAVALTPETRTALRQIPGVIGLVTSLSPAHLRLDVGSMSARCCLTSAEDADLGAALSGVFGLFSQAANVFPETVIGLQAACKENRIDEALCLQEGIRPMLVAFDRWGGPTVAKHLVGANLALSNSVRLPHVILSAEEAAALDAQMSQTTLPAG